MLASKAPSSQSHRICADHRPPQLLSIEELVTLVIRSRFLRARCRSRCPYATAKRVGPVIDPAFFARYVSQNKCIPICKKNHSAISRHFILEKQLPVLLKASPIHLVFQICRNFGTSLFAGCKKQNKYKKSAEIGVETLSW